jgi:hypothetical protein
MREYLNQQYRFVGRVVVPLLFAGLIAPGILQRVTWIPRWALDAKFPIAIVMVLLAFGRIRCRQATKNGAGDGNRTHTGGACGAEKQALWRDGESQV